MLQARLAGPDMMLPDVSSSEAQSVVDALNRQNERIFKVTLVSTVIVGTAALVSAYRTFRQIQREDAREEALLRQLRKRT